jgi:hypothetical protein
MLIDRSRFLKLAFTIAATTTTAVACTASDGGDEDSNAAAATGEAGGACTTKSDAVDKKPGEGAKTRAPFAYEEGYCFDLAVHEGQRARRTRIPNGPTVEGGLVHFNDFIFEHCRMYGSQLKPAVADKVKECLNKEDKKRKNSAGVPIREFDAFKMYECGKEALFSICEDGFDGNVTKRCERLTNFLAGADGAGPATDDFGDVIDGRPREKILNECKAILSGVKSSARAQIDACVTKDKFTIYGCFEGVREDFDGGDKSEDRSPEKNCSAASAGTVPAASACADVRKKVEDQLAEKPSKFGVPDFAESQCNDYIAKLEPAASELAIKCLLNPPKGSTYSNIFTCGNAGMRSVCRDPGLDDACAQVVKSIREIDRDANKGGRITRQCRELLPGLKPAAQQEVLKCVPDLAKEFGKDLARFAFYSCIEGI